MKLAGAAVAIAALLTAGPLEAQGPAVRSGRIVDAATGAPVAGALVEPVGLALRTWTDSTGTWQLAVDPAARLRVRLPGYVPRDVAAAAALVTLTPLPIALDAVIVTAARREQKLKDAIPEIALITRQDVERSAASDVGGVLAQATGVQLEGGVPSGTGVYLQGLGSQRVLILLDGQPMVGRLNGNFDLSRLASSAVERIEVVRGPQSTLYGSDAMGGVVNVITRPAAGGLAASVSALAGTQGRREASATVSGTHGRLGVLLDAGARGESLAPGLPGDDGTFARRWQAAPKLHWSFGTSALEASGLVVAESQRYRTGQLYHFADNVQAAGRLGWTWQRGARRIAPTLSFSSFDHLSRAATGSQPASDSGQRDLQQLVQGEVTASFPVPGGIADVGVQLRHESIRSDRVRGVSRALDGVETWAQGTWSLGSLSLTPGLRLAAHQQWGSSVTPRIAALLRLAPGIALRGSAGAGYRAPDFKELYLDFANPAAGYAVEGNPGLRPEHSRNVSLGIEAVGASVYGRVSAYHNEFRDFIDFSGPDAGGTYTYVNVGRGMTRGVETEAGWARGALRVDGGYALLDARDQTAGTPLLGRARHTARLAASLALGGGSVGATAQFIGRTPLTRSDSSAAITSWRSAWTRLDLRLSAPLRRTVSLVAGVENLFDHTVATGWPGFTGRRVYGGATWHAGRSLDR